MSHVNVRTLDARFAEYAEETTAAMVAALARLDQIEAQCRQLRETDAISETISEKRWSVLQQRVDVMTAPLRRGFLGRLKWFLTGE